MIHSGKRRSLTEHVAGAETLSARPAVHVEGPAAGVPDGVGCGLRDLSKQEAEHCHPENHGHLATSTASSLSHLSHSKKNSEGRGK